MIRQHFQQPTLIIMIAEWIYVRVDIALAYGRSQPRALARPEASGVRCVKRLGASVQRAWPPEAISAEEDRPSSRPTPCQR